MRFTVTGVEGYIKPMEMCGKTIQDYFEVP